MCEILRKGAKIACFDAGQRTNRENKNAPQRAKKDKIRMKQGKRKHPEFYRVNKLNIDLF